MLLVAGIPLTAFAGEDFWAVFVNGVPVTRLDFDRELGRELRNIQARETDGNSDFTRIKNTVLDKLIRRELLFQASQKAGVGLAANELEGELKSLKNRFVNPTAFRGQIESMAWNEEAVRREVERGMILKSYVTRVFVPQVTVSESESQKYYRSHPEKFHQPKMVRAGHIYVKVDPFATKTEKRRARKKIEKLWKKARKGEDFAQLATQHSECYSSERGGDLGFFKFSKMEESFAKAAFALDVGEISPIVETSYGFHIIKITGKKPSATFSYRKSREKIQNYLVRKKAWFLAMQHAEQLRKKARIEVASGLEV